MKSYWRVNVQLYTTFCVIFTTVRSNCNFLILLINPSNFGIVNKNLSSYKEGIIIVLLTKPKYNQFVYSICNLFQWMCGSTRSLLCLGQNSPQVYHPTRSVEWRKWRRRRGISGQVRADPEREWRSSSRLWQTQEKDQWETITSTGSFCRQLGFWFWHTTTWPSTLWCRWRDKNVFLLYNDDVNSR